MILSDRQTTNRFGTLQYKEEEYFGIIIAPANGGHDLLTPASLRDD